MASVFSLAASAPQLNTPFMRDFSVNNEQFPAATRLHTQADFSRFYDRYAPLLYGHLFQQTNSLIRARDLLETTFIQCWLRREELNQLSLNLPPGGPLSWLLSIAHEASGLVRQS